MLIMAEKVPASVEATEAAVALDWSQAAEVRPTVFGAVLTRLSSDCPPMRPQAASKSLRLSVRLMAGRRPAALAWPRPRRGWRLVVQSAVLDQSTEVQLFIAAHEYAHIYLGHRPWRGELAALVCRLAFLTAGAIAILRTRSAQTMGHGDVGLLLAIFTWSLIGAVLGGQAVAAACRRPLERAADEQAGRWGYPLTATAGLPMAAAEPLITRRWWFAPFRTHPVIADRIRLSEGVSPSHKGHSRR